MSNARFSIVQAKAVRDKRLDSDTFRLLCAYGTFSDQDGWCWPSQETIAEILPNKNRQWVNVKTNILVSLGYMEKRARFAENGGQLSNMYRLLFDTPPVKKDEETPTPPVTEHEGNDYTNVPLNVPSTNTANGENQPLPENTPLEWQILAGQEKIVVPDQKEAQIMDAANLLAMGTGVNRPIAYGIAYIFMKTRDIAIPQEKIKGNRKPLKSMMNAGVLPPHVEEAVRKLLEKNMTVVDLFSIEKTAIDIANPAPQHKVSTALEVRD